MPRPFAEITFTPAVKELQTKYGSRGAYSKMEAGPSEKAAFTDREKEFIHARDSFYTATVTDTLWPYVQHRGGPIGFLKVLDAHTLGFADFSGNAQFLSIGNLQTNDRVSLFLMDYVNRRRLKIWGRVRLVHEHEDPELVARLEMPAYRARVERAWVIELQAFDWNCPQHITPRFTETQIKTLVEPILEENRQLKAQLEAFRAGGISPTEG